MAKRKKGGLTRDFAVLLVELLGEGPENDEDRYKQAQIAMIAWSSSQGALIRATRELLWIKNDPDTYTEAERFRGW